MPSSGSTPDARLLAPLALVLFAAAVILTVVLSLGSGDESKPSGTPSPPPLTAPREAGRSAPSRRQRSTYTVRANDTLAAIAGKTGVPLERLQELNPELDPQQLVSGQRIKLR